MPFLVRKFLPSAKLLRALIKQHAVSVRRTIPTFHFPAGAANILSLLRKEPLEAEESVTSCTAPAGTNVYI